MEKQSHSSILFKALIVSIFFDAYALTYIQTFPVTLFTMTSVIYFFHALMGINYSRFYISKQNIILLLLSIILFINFTVYGFAHATSFLQALYFIVICFLAYRTEPKANFENYCTLYQKLMTISALYGIYQFIGRIAGLPLTDLIIDGHMVQGYNWTNRLYFFGPNAYRSNAIFREPSTFAQMLAISLALYFSGLMSKEDNKKKYAIPIVIQIVALITTMSGTGILLLLISLLIYSLLMVRNKRFWNKVFPYIIVSVAIAVYVLLFTTIGSYYLLRMNELFNYNSNAASGFVRFRAWILVVKRAWKSSFLFGIGIGSGADYIARYFSQYYAMTLNGFAKVATELGILGIGTWVTFILSFLAKTANSRISNKYLMLACTMVPFIFMGEAFSSNVFWLAMILLNCTLYYSDKDENYDFS